MAENSRFGRITPDLDDLSTLYVYVSLKKWPTDREGIQLVITIFYNWEHFFAQFSIKHIQNMFFQLTDNIIGELFKVIDYYFPKDADE